MKTIAAAESPANRISPSTGVSSPVFAVLAAVFAAGFTGAFFLSSGLFTDTAGNCSFLRTCFVVRTYAVSYTHLEREADAFAANLLAPEAVIKYQGFYSAPSLSSYFGISIAAANYIMMNMKMQSFWSLDRYEARLLAYMYPKSSRIHFNENGNVACIRLGNMHYLVNG